MTLDIVLRREGIDEVEAVGAMGDGVAAGVAHLVFARLFLDAFRLIGNAGLEIVMTAFVTADKLEADDISGEVITGVFHIGSHTERLTRIGVVEPVLALYVVGFLLFCMEGGCQEFYLCGVAEGTGDTGGTKEGTEDIFFLTVEVDLKRLYIFHRTEGSLTVLGLEIEMILRDITDEVNGPSLVWCITDICLIIKEIWSIFSSGF